MARNSPVYAAITTVFSIIFSSLVAIIVSTILEAGGNNTNISVLFTVILCINTVMLLAIYFSMNNTKNVLIGNLRKLNQDILSFRGMSFRAEEELFDAGNPHNYEGRVYRLIKNEVLKAEASLHILTVPGVGDGAIADTCVPMNCGERIDYFRSVEERIARRAKDKRRFIYKRIHQIPDNKNATSIEKKSLMHCNRLKEASNTYNSIFDFYSYYVQSQRSTGFIIVDNKTLIILLSAIDPNSSPYIASAIVFEKTQDENIADDINKLIDSYVRNFDRYVSLGITKPINLTDISIQERIKSAI